MMVSDFVALVRRMMGMETPGLIAMVIISLIVGAVTNKVASSLQSAVVLTVANLVVLLIWFEVWQSGSSLGAVVLTVCLAVTGHGLYRRMVKG